jgi:hypothetical protein
MVGGLHCSPDDVERSEILRVGCDIFLHNRISLFA